ncbi:lytic murein transglycosylase [bacterium]|nr:lytic murein transglycosylase [bacterium]
MVIFKLFFSRCCALAKGVSALALSGAGLVASAQDVRTYIPANAQKYLHWVTIQYKETWPEMPQPHYFPALIEHESCMSLAHARCWSPTSRLKTSREEGAGLGQLTRAYNSDGSIRFDALNNMRKVDPQGLNELRWDTVYQRPDLQIRVIVLMTRQNWSRIQNLVPEDGARLHMTDAAYNGGLGGLLNERRACAGRDGCDPNQWFGHVEKVCLKSTKPLYGGRSACDINRHHVYDVIHTRMPKYKWKV